MGNMLVLLYQVSHANFVRPGKLLPIAFKSPNAFEIKVKREVFLNRILLKIGFAHRILILLVYQ